MYAGIIWVLAWALSGTPDIFNHTSGDSAWIITGIICAVLVIHDALDRSDD